MRGFVYHASPSIADVVLSKNAFHTYESNRPAFFLYYGRTPYACLQCDLDDPFHVEDVVYMKHAVRPINPDVRLSVVKDWWRRLNEMDATFAEEVEDDNIIQF